MEALFHHFNNLKITRILAVREPSADFGKSWLQDVPPSQGDTVRGSGSILTRHWCRMVPGRSQALMAPHLSLFSWLGAIPSARRHSGRPLAAARTDPPGFARAVIPRVPRGWGGSRAGVSECQEPLQGQLGALGSNQAGSR